MFSLCFCFHAYFRTLSAPPAVVTTVLQNGGDHAQGRSVPFSHSPAPNPPSLSRIPEALARSPSRALESGCALVCHQPSLNSFWQKKGQTFEKPMSCEIDFPDAADDAACRRRPRILRAFWKRYSWIGHPLQAGLTLAFLLWLSDFKSETSF